jgi:hypothetical protein
LIIGKYIQVKHNTVAGIYFKVDGKVILGAKFKNYKLTWDYGTNMQPRLKILPYYLPLKLCYPKH